MPERIVDACCLINLYASGKVREILQVFAGGFFVPAPVKGESLFIRRPDDVDEAKLAPAAIDLAPELADGLLRECRLETTAETEEFVRFAAAVDDGEAMCLALAKSRGWVVATDDRKAIRLAGAEGVLVITTPELVKYWADARAIDEDTTRAVLDNIERFARFFPRSSSPFYAWWRRYTHPTKP